MIFYTVFNGSNGAAMIEEAHMSIREQRRAAHNNLVAKRRLRRQRAHRLRERGYSCAEIARELGISESYVRTIFDSTI